METGKAIKVCLDKLVRGKDVTHAELADVIEEFRMGRYTGAQSGALISALHMTGAGLTDKLMELLRRCKCGVFLIVNEHRGYYQSAEVALEELRGRECPPQIDDDVRQKMIETDTIVDLQFYHDNPIVSYKIYHYDLETALDLALSCLD